MAGENTDRKLDDIFDAIHAIDKTTSELKGRFEEHLSNDERNLSALNASLSKINDNLQEYNTQLQVHIKGTEVNAAGLVENRKQTELMIKGLQDQITPLTKSEITKQAVWKTLVVQGSILVGLASIMTMVLKWLGHS